MPSIPLGPCTLPGCKNPRVSGSTRCEAHRTEQSREFDQRRDPTIVRFYGSPAWQKARRSQLAREPNCRACGAPATDVDHVVAIRDGGARTDPANLQSLCSRDHDAKSGRERRARARSASGA